jgi:hypothetical protein
VSGPHSRSVDAVNGAVSKLSLRQTMFRREHTRLDDQLGDVLSKLGSTHAVVLIARQTAAVTTPEGDGAAYLEHTPHESQSPRALV